MNDRIHPPLLLRRHEPPRDGLDRLLHDFFRAEMPKPWPRMSALDEELTARAVPARPSRWLGVRRQLAVAAAVGLVLIGYLALARSFPGINRPAAAPRNTERDMGKKLDVPKLNLERTIQQQQPKTVTLPNGGRAHMWEQHLPGRRVNVYLEGIETPPSRR